MTFDALGLGALDYLPCRYGTSKLLFRGPRRSLDSPYIAFIGATETYGRFVEAPFPSLVEDALGVNCINLGQLNAGIDAFVHDPFVIDAACDAQVTVLQIMGAQNMSNRLFSVHPRRNDRFVEPSSLLKLVYREVDFSEFHFNKHMLKHLLAVSPERFETVRDELQQAWIARMQMALRRIKGKLVLLWMARHAPGDNTADMSCLDLGADPLFVTREMIDKVRADVTRVVEFVPSEKAVQAGTDGMVFGELEEAAARETFGPAVHREAASELARVIEDII